MVLIVLVIVLGFASFCLGKYTGYVTIQVRTEIANPKFAVEFSGPVEISAIDNQKTYTFTVKNYEIDENENKTVSEVDLEYFVQILSNTDETIKYELYKNNELIEINENLASNYIKMNSNDINEHNYSLKIIYDKSEKTNETADIVDETKIKVYCKQVKIG